MCDGCWRTNRCKEDRLSVHEHAVPVLDQNIAQPSLGFIVLACMALARRISYEGPAGEQALVARGFSAAFDASAVSFATKVAQVEPEALLNLRRYLSRHHRRRCGVDM